MTTYTGTYEGTVYTSIYSKLYRAIWTESSGYAAPQERSRIISADSEFGVRDSLYRSRKDIRGTIKVDHVADLALLA